jgi:hypothetical protein
MEPNMLYRVTGIFFSPSECTSFSLDWQIHYQLTYPYYHS